MPAPARHPVGEVHRTRRTQVNGAGRRDADDPGEVALFWRPPAQGDAFYWGLAVDRSGTFWVSDHGNETVWRARDADASGAIDASEETLFFQSTGSTWWDVVLREDGAVLLCEDDAPDRVMGLFDRNLDGDALDPGEAVELYSDAVSAIDTRPRGAALMRAPTLSIAPQTVRLGQTTVLTVRTPRPTQLAVLVISPRIVPVPLSIPPFGWLELDPVLLISFATGISDASASFALPLPVPNDPSLVRSFGFQALAGGATRLWLSDARVLTVTQ